MRIMFACNAIGEILIPVFIGNSNNPRCFSKVDLKMKKFFLEATNLHGCPLKYLMNGLRFLIQKWMGKIE